MTFGTIAHTLVASERHPASRSSEACVVHPKVSFIAYLSTSQLLPGLQSAKHSAPRKRCSICSNKRASRTRNIQSKLNWRGRQRSKYFSTRCEGIAAPQSTTRSPALLEFQSQLPLTAKWSGLRDSGLLTLNSVCQCCRERNSELEALRSR